LAGFKNNLNISEEGMWNEKVMSEVEATGLLSSRSGRQYVDESLTPVGQTKNVLGWIGV
jgi:hypothetical protein